MPFSRRKSNKKITAVISLALLVVGIFWTLRPAPASALGDLISTGKFTLLAPLPFVSNNNCDPSTTNAVCTTDFLTYLAGMFKLAIAAAAILAVVFITYGGFKYVTSVSLGGKEGGRETIQNALIGLVMALLSYLFLQTINPSLVKLNFNISGSNASGSNASGNINQTPAQPNNPPAGTVTSGGNSYSPGAAPSYDTQLTN